MQFPFYMATQVFNIKWINAKKKKKKLIQKHCTKYMVIIYYCYFITTFISFLFWKVFIQTLNSNKCPFLIFIFFKYHSNTEHSGVPYFQIIQMHLLAGYF